MTDLPKHLEALVEPVLIGGNHLALLIGADHPPYTAEPADALEHYGAGDTYDVWCAWRAIMLFRDAISPALTEHEQRVRREALEEAAGIAENFTRFRADAYMDAPKNIAQAIREAGKEAG